MCMKEREERERRERERESRVADLCVGWAPDTGFGQLAALPIGASWIQSLKTNHLDSVCVCVWCVFVGEHIFERVYMSYCNQLFSSYTLIYYEIYKLSSSFFPG